MPANPYTIGLDKNAANYTPLSPLSFIERTASVYPQRASVIHGARRFIATCGSASVVTGSTRWRQAPPP